MEAIRGLLGQLYARLLAWVHASSPATLQLTGILGLALVVIGYYHFKGNDSGQQRRRGAGSAGTAARGGGSRPAGAAGVGGAAGPSSQGAGSSRGRTAAAAPPQPAPVARDTPGRAVSGRLQGVRRVTLACPGVLLQQWQPGQLTESATLWPGVAEVVKEMAYISDVYLVGQVTDDIGQALVSGALEAAGLVGPQRGQVPAHRLLFCSTLEGKVAIVRQLESELHIDSAAPTIDALQRFMPALWHVRGPAGTGPDAGSAPNVAKAPSLTAFFGL